MILLRTSSQRDALQLTDWQESFIVNLYNGKGDALNRGNYRGLKLIEQVMKVLLLFKKSIGTQFFGNHSFSRHHI